MKKLNYDWITTTIEREWLAQIIAGTKKIEYREIKPYKALREGLSAVRTAPAQRYESTSARSHGVDPQDHATRWRLLFAHQESPEPQALGQVAAEAQTLIRLPKSFSLDW